MDTEDGRLFVKHLAYYIRTHEKALADSLLSQRQQRRHSTSNSAVTASPDAWKAANRGSSGQPRPSTSGGLLSSFPMGRSNKVAKPPRLFLTPNQLYYLLVRFEELGVNTGPLNVRVEHLHADTPSSNYMSFLTHTPSPNVRDSDADSIHSVVSTRSTMSSINSIWSHFSLSGSAASRAEKQDAAAREDIRYIYSAFTKIPCMKLSVDARFRPITGFEEFPFDTAIPMHAFKNLSELEISDIDYRSVYGWDRLAEQLQVLVVKRASLDDVSDLLTKIVLDDMDQRRRRNSKTPGTPISAYPSHNPFRRSGDWSNAFSMSDSPTPERRPASSDANRSPKLSGVDGRRGTPRLNTRGISPQQLGDSSGPFYSGARPISKYRRSSHSTSSTPPNATPQQSSSNLSLMSQLPPFKWRFLRHLSIADNSFTSITAEALAPVSTTLHSLDLSSNLFTEIPDCLNTLTSLRALIMSNCMIDSVRSLTQYPLPLLNVLNVRGNRISSLVGIESLKALQRLDLRDNMLTDPDEIARLTCMIGFYDVFVKGNPFTKTHQSYRLTIFNLFRKTPGFSKDVTIDTEAPSYNERRQLIERIPEATSNALLASSMAVEEATVRLVGPDAKTASVQAARAEDDSINGVDVTDGGATIKASKQKTVKKRIVDLATAQVHLRGPDVRATGEDPQPDQEDKTSAEPETPTKAPAKQGESRLGADSPTGAMSSGNAAREEAQTKLSDVLSQSSDTYRKQIEALKNDHGNAWLSAIGSIGPSAECHQPAGNHAVAAAPGFAPRHTPTTIAAGSDL